MARTFAALLVVLLGASGADAQPVDWNAVAAEGTLVIATKDADGAPRETTVWLVVVDGQGYVRTGDTHWRRNIERGSDIVVRIRDVNHWGLIARDVTDPALRAQIHAAFREKYGFSDTFVGWFASEEKARIMALVASQSEPTQ